ncbi:hypothetical protein [Crenobacter cavernae]|uniref:Uncharacterized protein n=1 Tax=Crenobacter cavernae TaxID=2290923 RepID=A0ABY0FAI7_9NEIS|nr:hypothetical protein [Crenobacter cavernae]RXZ42676.1 hypothetical protein EBB06_12330 [Crenobacter cavernae]
MGVLRYGMIVSALCMAAMPALSQVKLEKLKDGERKITFESESMEQKGELFDAFALARFRKGEEPKSVTFLVMRSSLFLGGPSERWPWRQCPAGRLLADGVELPTDEPLPPVFKLSGDYKRATYFVSVTPANFEKAALAGEVGIDVCGDTVTLPARFQLDMRKAIDLYRLR